MNNKKHKAYTKPAMEIVSMEGCVSLLAGSEGENTGGETPGWSGGLHSMPADNSTGAVDSSDE